MKVIGALKSRAQPDPSLVLYRDRPQMPINGVGRLPAAMTINSVTEYPTFRYTAGGGLVDAADWRPWGYGENLDIVAVATAPTLLAGSPGLGPMDQSVKFNASDYFQAANNTFADITTEDVVIEFVAKFIDESKVLFGKYTASDYWEIQSNTANSFRFYANGATGSATLISGSLTEFAWHHVLVFYDASGSAQIYLDGAASGSAVAVSGVGSLTVAAAFCLGARSAGSTPTNASIAYAAMWKGAGWLDTHLQATVAEQRASLFWGWRPQQARGTAVPTVRTRASNAYLDRMHYDGTRRLYLVGNNVPRAVERVDSNGATLKGYLSEVQITNLVTRSEEIDVDGAGSPWTHTRCSVTNTSTTTLPNGLTSSNDVIHEDGTAASSHPIANAISVTNGVKYACSFFAKAINRPNVRLQISGIVAATWELTNGTAVGVPTGVVEQGSIAYGNGWWRCWITFIAASTGTLSWNIFPVSAGIIFSFDGLDQDSIYLWGNQAEAGVDYPTSYMPTAAATVIREEDTLRYKGDDGNLGGVGSNKRGGFSCSILPPDVNIATNTIILDITDGGSTADRIVASTNVLDQPVIQTAASGGSAGSTAGTSDVFDGEKHSLRYNYKANDLEAIVVDGSSEGSSDTDCGMPDELDRIDVGVNTSGVGQINFPIADIELFPRESRD